MLSLYDWRDVKNFGDALSPLLFERVFNTPVTYAPIQRADAIAIGSLLQVLCIEKRPPHHQRHKLAFLESFGRMMDVWGTGTLHGDCYPFFYGSLEFMRCAASIVQNFFLHTCLLTNK